jgi:hypothetical protein
MTLAQAAKAVLGVQHGEPVPILLPRDPSDWVLEGYLISPRAYEALLAFAATEMLKGHVNPLGSTRFRANAMATDTCVLGEYVSPSTGKRTVSFVAMATEEINA